MSTDSVIRSEMEFEVEQMLNMVTELKNDGEFDMTGAESNHLGMAKFYLELALTEIHTNNERWD